MTAGSGFSRRSPDLMMRCLMLLHRQSRAHELGQRGHVYVQRYDWSRIAAEMLETYRWLLGHCPDPQCIRLN